MYYRCVVSFRLPGPVKEDQKRLQALPPSASFQRAEGKRRKMKICKYQKGKSMSLYSFHLEDEYLAGKRAPYFICRLYPKCDRTDCPYVHFILPTSSSSASSDGCN